MEVILFECKASECNFYNKCVHEVRYKVIHCLETLTYSFFILNNHPIEWKCDKVKLSDEKGMTPKVKRLVEHLYYDCEIGRPKLIEEKIHNKYKKKIEKDANGTIPFLDKIQNYVKVLQRAISESNNLADIQAFIIIISF